METKFQTSFIPNKTLSSSGGTFSSSSAAAHRGVASIFMIIGVIVFLASIAGAGTAYFWKQQIITAQEQYKNDLVQRQQQFGIQKIQDLKQLNTQIDLAKQILKNHVAVSQIFDIVSHLTIQSVRFLSLDLTVPPVNAPVTNSNSSNDIKISMHGYASNLSSVAFQSDVLGSLEQYGLHNIVKNPILSDPGLEANKTVSFGFTAAIDASSLLYTKLVTGTSTVSTP